MTNHEPESSQGQNIDWKKRQEIIDAHIEKVIESRHQDKTPRQKVLIRRLFSEGFNCPGVLRDAKDKLY